MGVIPPAHYSMLHIQYNHFVSVYWGWWWKGGLDGIPSKIMPSYIIMP